MQTPCWPRTSAHRPVCLKYVRTKPSQSSTPRETDLVTDGASGSRETLSDTSVGVLGLLLVGWGKQKTMLAPHRLSKEAEGCQLTLLRSGRTGAADRFLNVRCCVLCGLQRSQTGRHNKIGEGRREGGSETVGKEKRMSDNGLRGNTGLTSAVSPCLSMYLGDGLL